MDCPQIAVVIACYNAVAWIGQAIESVIRQQRVAADIIIVNDGSTDETAKIIDQFSGRVSHLRVGRGGPSAARNIGLLANTKQKILFLDADDYLNGNYLQHMLFESNQRKAHMTFGGYQIEDTTGVASATVYVPQLYESRSLLKSILRGNFPQTACVLWDAGFLKQIGAWRPDIWLGEDVELLIRALLRDPRIAHCASGCVIYRNHDSPERLTHDVSLANLEKQFSYSLSLVEAAQKLGDNELLHLFGFQHYNLAKRAYAFGFAELGEKSLVQARQLGFYGHAGSWGERTIAALVGLRLQTKVMTQLRCVRALRQPGHFANFTASGTTQSKDTIAAGFVR